MENLSHILKNSRKSHQLTMKGLSHTTGIDQALISKYESGLRYPSSEHIRLLSNAFTAYSDEIMTTWISEKVYALVKDYPTFAEEALHAAEDRISYLTKAQALESPVLPDILLDQLNRIDQLHATWRALQPLSGVALQKMREHFHLSYTHESNRIEGNTLTLQDTYFVVSEGLTISGKTMHEHLEAINHSEAISFIESLIDRKEPLTARTLNEIHALILRGIDTAHAGKYRTVPVRISGSAHVPPQPYLIDKHMEDYFRFYDRHKDSMHPVILAAEMHERLVTIHPYIDGNGRTSRLVMNLILQQHGYTIANLKGDTDSRMRYYQALQSIQTDHDATSFYELIANAVEESLSEHIAMVGGIITT